MRARASLRVTVRRYGKSEDFTVYKIAYIGGWPSLSTANSLGLPCPCRCVFCSDRACPELVEGAGILTSSSARRRSRFPLTSPHNREDTIPCSNSSLKTEYRMANSFGDKILPVSPGRSIVYSHFQSPQKLLP